MSHLQFHLEESLELSLEIYDAIGALVKEVMNGQNFESGHHQIALSLAAYDSGMYFIALRSKDGVWTEKLMILK